MRWALALLQGWVDRGRSPTTGLSSRLLSLTGAIRPVAASEHDGDKHNANECNRLDIVISLGLESGESSIGKLAIASQIYFDLPPPLPPGEACVACRS
jgi:hypothetical protein